MLGKDHMIIGIICSAGISAVFLRNHTSLPVMGVFVAATACGSYLPDVDHPTSSICRRLPRTSKWFRNYFYSAGDIFESYDNQGILYSHRGICHSLSACLSLGYLLFPMLLGLWPLSGILLGMFLHIFFDALTPAGVMLFAPFSYRKFFKKQSSDMPAPPKYRLPGLYYFLLFVIYTINLLLSILRVCFPLFILYILAMLGDIFILKAESSMLLPFVLVCSLLLFYKLIHYFLQWIVFKVNDFFLITPAAPSDTNQSMM